MENYDICNPENVQITFRVMNGRISASNIFLILRFSSIGMASLTQTGYDVLLEEQRYIKAPLQVGEDFG